MPRQHADEFTPHPISDPGPRLIDGARSDRIPQPFQIGRSVIGGNDQIKSRITVVAKRIFRAVRDDYTARDLDFIINVADTGSARTITLPAVAAVRFGKHFIIKDGSGAAGTNNITIQPDGSDTIDGAGTKVISTNFGWFSIFCSESEWLVIGSG